MWGGEPLLRQDLPELLRAARHAGLLTTLITNGWLIGKRWPELRGHVDALILSLDDVGPAHDRLRGLPGLYERLQAFVDMLADDPLRPTLLVNTVLSNLNRGAFERVAAVAADWHAGLYFCPMETGAATSAGIVTPLAELALSPAQLSAVAGTAAELKRAGYPILATAEYLDLLARDPDLQGYTCRAPAARLTVAADGTVRDCLHTRPPAGRRGRPAGRPRAPLPALFSQPRYRAMTAQATHCRKCNNPDVIELSWLWDLRPAMLRKVLQLSTL